MFVNQKVRLKNQRASWLKQVIKETFPATEKNYRSYRAQDLKHFINVEAVTGGVL